MKYRLEQLHNDLKKFSLKASEKQEIRSHLLSYLEANPIPESVIEEHRETPVVSPFYTKVAALPAQVSKFVPTTSLAWYRFFRSSSYVTGFVVLALILGGGVSLAAENALPGQTLYSVKTNINEGVQSLLAVSDEAQARLQAKFAGRRLEEAEKLAIKGELNDTVKAQIEEKLKTHTDNFKTQARKLETSKKYTTVVTATSDFESTLKAHEGVLSALEIKDQNTTSVAAQVKVALNDVQTSRLTVETKVKTDSLSDATTTADIASTSAQTVVDAKVYVSSIKDTIGFDTYIDAMARIQAAEASLKDGQTKFAAGAFGDAFVSFQDAERQAKEARMSLEATASLNIDPDGILKPGTGTTTVSTTPRTCVTSNDCSLGYVCSPATTTPSTNTASTTVDISTGATASTTTSSQYCKLIQTSATTTATTTISSTPTTTILR